MICRACNKILSDFEATRRYKSNPEEFVEMCNPCFKPIEDQVPTITRPDLINTDDNYDDDDGVNYEV